VAARITAKSARSERTTIHVLILVPVIFVMMKERAFRKGMLG
jgi:hypothetical protein